MHLGRHGEKTSGAEPESPVWFGGSGFRVPESGLGLWVQGIMRLGCFFGGVP